MEVSMRVTVIIKYVTDAFFDGIPGSFKGLNQMSAAEKFAHLSKNARDFGMTMKIGTGQFRDAVDLNALLRGPHTITYALLPRRGYRIAEFIVTAPVKPPAALRISHARDLRVVILQQQRVRSPGPSKGPGLLALRIPSFITKANHVRSTSYREADQVSPSIEAGPHARPRPRPMAGGPQGRHR
jgi:hypothetical protein